MSKVLELNKLYADLYEEKDQLEAAKISNKILTLLEDLHLSKSDPMIAQLTRANYAQSFKGYLDNLDSRNNPFTSQIDIIRQIVSHHYRLGE